MPILTVHQVKKTLRNAIAYITDSAKTLNGQAVSFEGDSATWSTHNTRQQNIDIVTGRFEKYLDMGSRVGRKKILAHHLIQSFAPTDDVTWQQVHQMGVELAQQITGGRYIFLIATHVNKHHLHNHILICPVSTSTPHKRMRVVKTSLKKWRKINDEIAIKHGVKTIPLENASLTGGRNIKEVYASLGGEGKMQRLRNLINEATARSTTFDQFTAWLHTHGVSVTIRGTRISFTDHAAGLKTRGMRLGSWYTLEGVATRIAESGELACITVNKKLIFTTTPQQVVVWLPTSRRTEQAVLPRRTATTDGTTWTLWLSHGDTIPVKNVRGGYSKIVSADDLLTQFGQANVRWFETYKDQRYTRMRDANRLTAKSNAQRKWLDWVSRRQLEMQDSIYALNAIRQWGDYQGGGLTADTIEKALTNADREIRRLHELHSQTLGMHAKSAESMRAADQHLEDLERRAANVEHQARLMKHELEKITGTQTRTPTPQADTPREQNWRAQPVSQRQKEILEAFAARSVISTQQAQNVENMTRGEASTLIEQTINRLNNPRDSRPQPRR